MFSSSADDKYVFTVGHFISFCVCVCVCVGGGGGGAWCIANIKVHYVHGAFHCQLFDFGLYVCKSITLVQSVF